MPGTDVVMIMIDDLFSVDRFRTAFGVTVQTPNLDRLAAQGVSFDNAYASVALCNPSRTSIMTSLNPHDTAVHYNTDLWYEHVDPATTLPALMMQAGYTTYGFGKTFHTTVMPDVVKDAMFDQFYAPTAEEYLLAGEDVPAYGVYEGNPDALGDALAVQAAIAALQGHAGPDPLFLLMGLVDPHGPFIAPSTYFDLYPLDQIVVPEWEGDTPPDYIIPFLNGKGLAQLREDGLLPAVVQAYFANISEMDHRLGQLLDAIDSTGRDPAILLTSDHGYSLGDHDTLHKFTLWEQAANAPLILYHPDMVARGVTHEGVVSLLDIAPTLLEIAGVPIPASMQGHSLLAAGLDIATPTFGEAMTQMSGSFSLRIGDWRYTRYEDGSVELFDVAADPANEHNLHGDPGHAGIEAELAGDLAQRVAALGVTFDPATGITMHGAPEGDTQYFLADAGVLASITDAGGEDIVYSGSALVTMPDWLERYVALAQVATTIFGGAGANDIGGFTERDEIHGGAGNDTLNGVYQDDLLFGDAGDDGLLGGDGNDTLFGGAGNDRLSGLEDDDALFGGAGRDNMLGGTGDDRMAGGGDDDTYFVEEAGDLVVEEVDAGRDRVLASLDYTLTANVEDLLIKTGLATGLALTGNAAVNRITGGGGGDTLDGGGGRDTLLGGLGDDTYRVDTTGVAVVERADGGFDLVRASIDFTLAVEVEALVLTGSALRGTGNALGNRLTGTAGDNSLDGREGADTLDGGGGRDTLTGGSGDDTYRIDAAGVTVVELANGGTDRVVSSLGMTLGANVENLTFAGSAALRGFGNTLANVMTGNAGDDYLDGGAAADTLVGGSGRDVLIGGAGADRFVLLAVEDSLRATRDVIKDFEQGFDRIDLSAIGVGSFHLAAAGTFSGWAMELRFIQSASTTLIQGDTDGNRTADFEVALIGVFSLNASDFLL